jgi:hypothetical protein
MLASSWRVVGLGLYGAVSALHVSAAHLYDSNGDRIDESATLSCSHTPSAGALADLQDASLATSCTIPGATTAGFFLRWDFAGDTEVSSLRFGGASVEAGFPWAVTFQYLDAGVWKTINATNRQPFPGVSAINLPGATGSVFDPVLGGVWLSGNGVDGAGIITDDGPLALPVTKTGTVTTSTLGAKFDTCLRFDSAGWVSCTHPNLAFGTGDFTIAWWQQLNTASGDHAAFQMSDVAGGLKGSDQTLSVWVYSGGKWGIYLGSGAYVFTTANRPAVGQIVHVALVRLDGVLTLYVDGAVAYSAPHTVDHPWTHLVVGAYYSAAYPFNGRVDDFAVLPGVALFSGVFTPPAAPIVTKFSLDTSTEIVRGGIPIPLAQVDVVNGGPYALNATVSNAGSPNVPVRRRVRLHDQRDGQMVREAWSRAGDGVYSFDKIRAGKFYVLALDHTGTYGAVIESDVVVPAP